MAEDEWCTVQVANLPLETSRADLEHVFAEIGPVRKCFVLKPREGKKTNLGFVTFASPEDCRSALEREDLELEGAVLRLTIKPDRKDWSAPAVPRLQQNSVAKSKARLVVRNLSFQAEEDSLREHFASVGQLVDVNILRKPDGRMVGCAFVEFKRIVEATKAVETLNGSRLLGRAVAVDWAVPKEVFKGKEPEKEIKEDKVEELKEEVKEEEEDDDSERIAEWVKEEEDSDEDGEDEGVEEEDAEEDEEEEESEEVNRNQKKPHNLTAGHDVGEERTVFIRNLSYDSEESDLKSLMEDHFGRVAFARLVMDKAMGHPRGTAFVKFLRKEDAAKAILEASPDGEQGIFLAGRRLGVLLAQEKAEVEQKQKKREEDNKAAKDGRNLYLAREGMVREGTMAAEGVSAADMAKRKMVEKQKKHLLKNLNMFVSATRLCVRNLAPSVDDSKLKKMFTKQVPKTAKISECRVMRELGAGGAGKAASKGYAFVDFAKHEDALAALRNVNNNPTIATNDQRPIVEFSIENRKALLARQKRLEKSREKNPNLTAEQKKKMGSTQKLSVKTLTKVSKEVKDKQEFTGMTADPAQRGLPSHAGAKVRTNRKQVKISRKDLRKKEQERKDPKLKRKRKIADDAVKENHEAAAVSGPPDAKKAKKALRKTKKVSKEAAKEKESEKKFSSLVSQYKSTLQNNSEVRKKWFE